VRQGAGGRRLTFNGLLDQFLPGKYDPPSFALRLAHKDVALANALGRELSMPMRMCNLAFAEMTEALNRGWGDRDSRSVMLLQQERAGIKVAVEPERLRAATASAKNLPWLIRLDASHSRSRDIVVASVRPQNSSRGASAGRSMHYRPRWRCYGLRKIEFNPWQGQPERPALPHIPHGDETWSCDHICRSTMTAQLGLPPAEPNARFLE
jgi:hypothetical protein